MHIERSLSKGSYAARLLNVNFSMLIRVKMFVSTAFCFVTVSQGEEVYTVVIVEITVVTENLKQSWLPAFR